MELKDLTGMRFGRLTVISRAPDRVTPSGQHSVMWNAVCDCGNERTVNGSSLKQGLTNSCGCILSERMEKRNTVHGGRNSRLYAIWHSMKQRTENPKAHSYRWYGARGISVCDEWKDGFGAFQSWAIKTGYDPDAPRGKSTLDRIDPDGDYCPDNCRWVDMHVQNSNKRKAGEKRAGT